MADNNNQNSDRNSANKAIDAAVAPAKAAQAAAERTSKTANASAKRAYTKRKTRTASLKAAATRKKASNTRAAAPRRAATDRAGPFERTTSNMTNDFTSMFTAFPFPGAERFPTMFGLGGSRREDLANRGQQVASQLGEMTRSNLEAIAEAGRIAANGVRAISEDALAASREGLELAASNAKSLAAATSPSEYFQRQTELARASFDRMVAQSSKLTEQVVKLAGEAIQPISTRASVNAESINALMA